MSVGGEDVLVVIVPRHLNVRRDFTGLWRS